MTRREREALRRFAAKCERLWPGCTFTVRPAGEQWRDIITGYAEQQQKFLRKQENAPDDSGKS